MLELLGRTMPVQISRGQAIVVLAVLLVLGLLGVTYVIAELIFGRGADVTLRLTGHRRPRKTSARTAIDQLEKRIQHRQ